MKALITIIVVIAGFTLGIFAMRLDLLSAVIFATATILFLQGLFATTSMLYTWMDKKNMDSVRPPQLLYGKPARSFSLIVPARHEAEVIGDTIQALATIDYPKDLYEVLVVVRSDDTETIEAVEKSISQITDNRQQITGDGKGANLAISNNPLTTNIRLITYDGFPINKPRGLNIGLAQAKHDIVGVFDAEDEPHRDILTTIDTVFSHKGVDVVQSAVQLVNVTSQWFSALNSLEYYFWFKSILPMFSKLGSTPLGGNTVFFRRSILATANGWDEDILTEDADVGLRLSALGYRTTTIYEERLATIEETPGSVAGFVRQRSRWDQGYLQVLLKGDWMKLPMLNQQLLTLYLLLQPLIHHFAILGFVFIPLFALGAKVPVWLALYSFLPMYFFLLQVTIALVGLAQLSSHYKLKIKPIVYGSLLLTYIPYQLLLSYASFRALWRLLTNVTAWEKTTHANMHRSENQIVHPI